MTIEFDVIAITVNGYGIKLKMSSRTNLKISIQFDGNFLLVDAQNDILTDRV
ncbi:hypothetical protein MACH07_18600 [Flagellimonas marinaquae]|uniref:Uncharacterized protein n=1 Tax=Flagellimonas marinaquae TaxID=254955 RepID=A0AA48HIS8_9FLAO|nr:hypothetical protein MACH07_18600 [Allomuricauda aquimarina]